MGQVGSTKKGRDRVVNIVFLVVVIVTFAYEMVKTITAYEIRGILSAISIEIALLLISVKIIWMIHQQSKIDHFQFWVLNSIEFQITQISERLMKLEPELKSAQAENIKN